MNNLLKSAKTKLSLHIDNELLAKLKERVKAEDINISQAVRKAIRFYIASFDKSDKKWLVYKWGHLNQSANRAKPLLNQF